jgi:hypothetical protein
VVPFFLGCLIFSLVGKSALLNINKDFSTSASSREAKIVHVAPFLLLGFGSCRISFSKQSTTTKPEFEVVNQQNIA